MALSLVADWYDIDPQANDLEAIEARLRVLAGAGMVAIRVWSEEFEEVDEGVEPSADERAKRRAQIMCRRAITEEIAEGKTAFNEYAATFRAEAHTRLVLDQQSKLERRVERLTQSAQDELSRLIDALSDSRDALNNALPGTDGAVLKEKISELNATIRTLETLIQKKHGRKGPWATFGHRVLEVLWEATKIILGIFLAGVIIFLAKLPFLSQVVDAGYKLIEHESSAASPATSHTAPTPPAAPTHRSP